MKKLLTAFVILIVLFAAGVASLNIFLPSETKQVVNQVKNLPAFQPTPDPSLSFVKLPPGFNIREYANVPNARSMVMSEGGVLYVGTRAAGAVYAVVTDEGGFKRVVTVAENLREPNGVAIQDGNLYIGAVDKIYRISKIDEVYDKKPKLETIVSDYPSDALHGWRYIAFGPDKKLYVPVGAPCNACERSEEIYSTITRLNVETKEKEIIARGVRNSVGFDWNPENNELWFTDNGRDQMGDNVPRDELNRLADIGTHFGFPYCHEASVPDPELGDKRSCGSFVAPSFPLSPHGAALGMKFYTKTQFPPEYQGGIFIAEHGSWNRADPIGYRVMFAKKEEGKIVSYMPFAEGWLNSSGQILGRPVDILVTSSGSLLVSDDDKGKIYEITYTQQSATPSR